VRALKEKGLQAVQARLPHANTAGPTSDPAWSEPKAQLARTTFRTVVLWNVLDRATEGMRPDILADAWRLVEAPGRLIAVEPNQEGDPERPSPQRLDHQALGRLLEPLGRPRLATDQPFRWLVMYVDRPRPIARRGWSRARVDRYHATAQLCRGRVIELGCGEGHLAGVISDSGLEVVGVDHSARKIRQARVAYPSVAFVESDILALDASDGPFDTAVLAEVLEHVDEPTGAAMLAKAWSLLRPAGRLVVSVPNEGAVPHRHHIRRFNRRSLEALLRSFGRPVLVTDQPFRWLMAYVDKQ
jgi:hypothetical protein